MLYVCISSKSCTRSHISNQIKSNQIIYFNQGPIKGKQSKEEILHTMISNDYVRHTNIYTQTYIYEATCEIYMLKTKLTVGYLKVLTYSNSKNKADQQLFAYALQN